MVVQHHLQQLATTATVIQLANLKPASSCGKACSCAQPAEHDSSSSSISKLGVPLDTPHDHLLYPACCLYFCMLVLAAVLPNGAVTGLDIGFSNASLVHITMSFYTMCKSTTPIFLLAFAFMWGLET